MMNSFEEKRSGLNKYVQNYQAIYNNTNGVCYDSIASSIMSIPSGEFTSFPRIVFYA